MFAIASRCASFNLRGFTSMTQIEPGMRKSIICVESFVRLQFLVIEKRVAERHRCLMLGRPMSSSLRRRPKLPSANGEAKCPQGSPHGLLERFVGANDPRHHTSAKPETVK